MKSATGPILVPLDGSSLAESALPWAAHIAKAWGAPLLLARVVGLCYVGAAGLTDTGMSEMALCNETECAAIYLRDQAARLRAAEPALAVNTSLTLGKPAAELLGVERRRRPRLVVVGTHGRMGLARWAFRSVADALVRGATAPVLLVRRENVPGPSTGGDRQGLRVLAALDGSPRAEQVLPVATSLAAGAGGGLVLTSVVQMHAERAIGPYFHPTQEAQRRDAAWYLAQRSADAHAKGVAVRVVANVGHDVAGSIADLAAREAVDVIALSTPGRGALGRLLRGSVADHVAHAARMPVLLLRPAGAARQPAAEAAAEARVRAHVASRARPHGGLTSGA